MKTLLKNQRDIVSIFLTTLLFVGTFGAGYVRAQNVGDTNCTRGSSRQRTHTAVRDAIVDAVLGVNNANDVTEAHLAAIMQLDLNDKQITTLKEGDFSGLSALTRIDLRRNQLTALPEGAFQRLVSINTPRP